MPSVINNLPPEILASIGRYTDTRDLYNLRQTSQYLKGPAENVLAEKIHTVDSVKQLYHILSILPRESLKSIDTSNIRISDEHIRNILKDQHHFRSLTLTNHLLSESAIHHIIGTQFNIEELDLSIHTADENRTQLTASSFPVMQEKNKLKRLSLSGMRINTECLREISKLPKLTELNLSKMRLTSDSLSALSPVSPALKKIDIYLL